MVFKAYESFLLNNASQITAVESAFRSLTYFLPGRFKDAELAGEAIYSAMEMLGLYHDEILKRLVIYRDIDTSGPQQQRRPLTSAEQADALLPHTPSPHARYTNHYSNTSSVYKLVARMLVLIGYTELLAEMVARRKLSSKKAWDVVLGIEAFKASLRILLLQLTSDRLSIDPPIPEREVDPAVLEQEKEERLLAQLRETAAADTNSENRISDAQQAAPTTASPAKDTWTGSRTGFVRPTLASLRRKRETIIDPITGQPAPSPPGTTPHSRPPSRSRSRSRFSNYSRSDSSDAESDSDSSDGTLVEPHVSGSQSGPPTPWTEKTINDFLTSKALSKEDVMKPTELVRSLCNKRGRLSEYIWILRPVLYVLALKKWGTRRWEPWTISLGVEYLSHFLRRSAYSSPALTGAEGNGGGLNPILMGLLQTHPVLRLLGHLIKSSTSNPKPASQVEDQEWSKRKRAFLWYLLRGPFWRQYTRVRVNRLCDKLDGKMLLGIVAAMVRDYVPLVDDLYFYTATQ